jgi:hypothetical protein
MAQEPKPLRRNYNVFQRNSFNVRPGDPAFEIATNLCDVFELGTEGGNGHWLHAHIVEGEFLFSGRLFARGRLAGTVLDNFPKATPEGWTRRQRVDGEGYELVDKDGMVLFGYRVDNKVCRVTVNIYDSSGEIVAESAPDELRVYQPPMRIGRSGVVWQ